MSKNQNRQFVSASGTANEVVQKLAQAVYALGGNDNDLRRIISDQTLCRELAAHIVRRDGLSLAQMITECQFRRVDDNIIEVNFPLTSGPVADAENMLTLTPKGLSGQDMTTAEIEVAIDQKGYRCATIAEQLAYAKAKWNGKDLVVALGSSWMDPDGRRFVPCLCEGGAGRELYLNWAYPEHRWRRDVLFLVVRK
jgi:hypothetical protein